MTSWTWVAAFLSSGLSLPSLLAPPQPVRRFAWRMANRLADWQTARHRFDGFFDFPGFLAPFVRQFAGSPADSAL